jgi:CheY-like chemotaxis protein
MPVLDGIEATRRLRLMEGASRHTPVIALTALAVRGDSEKCLDAGMDAYLSKPFKPDELLAMLGQIQASALGASIQTDSR